MALAHTHSHKNWDAQSHKTRELNGEWKLFFFNRSLVNIGRILSLLFFSKSDHIKRIALSETTFIAQKNSSIVIHIVLWSAHENGTYNVLGVCLYVYCYCDFAGVWEWVRWCRRCGWFDVFAYVNALNSSVYLNKKKYSSTTRSNSYWMYCRNGLIRSFAIGMVNMD